MGNSYIMERAWIFGIFVPLETVQYDRNAQKYWGFE